MMKVNRLSTCPQEGGTPQYINERRKKNNLKPSGLGGGMMKVNRSSTCPQEGGTPQYTN
jgi:hypothetical protein